jgi:hypothetical protein
MRSYKELLSFLLIREQLSLGWKILFFIVCGMLVYGSLTLGHVRFRSVDVFGTVLRDRTDVKENTPVNYLTVKLNNGETARVDATRNADYRPGRKVIVKETNTNFFGFKKHEFKRYVDEPRRD